MRNVVSLVAKKVKHDNRNLAIFLYHLEESPFVSADTRSRSETITMNDDNYTAFWRDKLVASLLAIWMQSVISEISLQQLYPLSTRYVRSAPFFIFS